jgi:hypothetical protein
MHQHLTASENVRDEIFEHLDLSQVKRKLTYAEQSEPWSQEMVDTVEADYRRFLWLIYLNLGTPIVPSKALDHFWHQHILDTVAYARDCQRIFGFFLHHNPYFGMASKEEWTQLEAAAKQTREIWLATFGETPRTDALCNGGSCSWLAAPSTCTKPPSCGLNIARCLPKCRTENDLVA